MINSGLIKLLKSLTKDELERFKVECMENDFFKKPEKSKKLFELIYQTNNHPTYDSEALNKDRICQILYPEKNLKKRKQSLYNLANVLQRRLLTFLARLEMEGTLYEDYFALKNLQDRGADEAFLFTYKQVTRERAKSKKTINSYYQQYLLEELLHDFAPSNRHLEKEKKKLDFDIKNTSSSFDNYVFLNKIQFYTVVLNSANIRSEEEKDKYIELAKELIQIIENDKSYEEILIRLYYLNLLLLVKPNSKKHFLELRTILKSNNFHIGDSELKAIYTAATNYCIKRVRKGDSDFRSDLLDLYKEMIEKNMLYVNGYLLHSYVKNIVGLGLNLKEMKWVSDFVEKIKKDIHPEYRKSICAFSKAAWYFQNEDYSEAQKMLLEVGDENFFYKLNNRSFLLRCYYMQGEVEAFDYLIDAFRHLIRGQKIAKEHKDSYLNFIRFIGKLFKLKTAYSYQASFSRGAEKYIDKLQRLEGTILKTSPIRYKDWLLEKVEELM